MPSLIRPPSVGPSTTSPIAFLAPGPQFARPVWAPETAPYTRVGLEFTDPEERSVIMCPAPRKPVTAPTSHMLVPRLDASTPAKLSGSGPEDMDAADCLRKAVLNSSASLRGMRGSSGMGKLGHPTPPVRPTPLSTWSDLAPVGEPLTPVNENMENAESEDGFSSDYSEDDAYAELLEIVSKPKAHVLMNFNSPVSRDGAKGHRRRKSSVPSVFFGMEASLERFAAMHGPSVGAEPRMEPPRLSKTPFRPKESDSLTPGADLRILGTSPVSRTKNPVPLNSPFCNKVQTVTYNHEPGVELGLLSPSPSPDIILHRPSFFRADSWSNPRFSLH
ncbi:hypothetical protein HDV00_006256 [Rhizophlyctis rosea]|nr:hypothetical protein HDV00_006256 [Rhizophlyctis rosea]